MGTWDTGPFDNDTAADFADALDGVCPDERVVLVHGVLVRTLDATGYLREAEEAVAAAALIAAQCPGGEPVHPGIGPEKVMPVFPSEFRGLADDALARIAASGLGPAVGWVEFEDARRWRAMVAALRAVLVPPLTEPLFEL